MISSLQNRQKLLYFVRLVDVREYSLALGFRSTHCTTGHLSATTTLPASCAGGEDRTCRRRMRAGRGAKQGFL
jgi:hypothetical protein